MKHCALTLLHWTCGFIGRVSLADHGISQIDSYSSSDNTSPLLLYM